MRIALETSALRKLRNHGRTLEARWAKIEASLYRGDMNFMIGSLKTLSYVRVCVRVLQSCLVAADAIPRDGEPQVANNELLPAERDMFLLFVLLWMIRPLSVFPRIPAHHIRNPSGCVDDCPFSRYAPFLSLIKPFISSSELLSLRQRNVWRGNND
ncbi:hypothetical protein EAG_03588 [Camponotus floridanus]|uniref:Uncharacterized protein n=1 Tax=Camponotus floridanus TaxID=104421 RepID=E2ANY6_CAMFO|nr:hypothetical protein EAG_03588 [Camponotus floridanus]